MANSPQQEDASALFFIMLAFLFGIGWAIWHYWNVEILEALRWLRLIELWMLAPVDTRAKDCAHWLYIAQIGNENRVSEEVAQAAYRCFGTESFVVFARQGMAYDFYNITGSSMKVISLYIGQYTRWLIAPVCLLVAVYGTFMSPRNLFKTRFNLETFIRAQAKIWPVISPVANFNPAKASARILGSPMPEKTPLFAEAFAPEEWLSYHRIAVVNGVPDREAARRAFLAQLGPRWNGFAGLPVHMQLLAAAFALKGVQKRDESDEFLGQISTFWTDKTGFKPSAEIVSKARAILKDPEVGGKALEVVARHAYRTTALLGLLKWARFMGGVLASAQFLWLRGVDRELWYSLNNLGRRSFHTEGAGAVAHFMAETAAEKALPTPRLDTAIITLNVYMSGDEPVVVPPRQGAKRT
ncbi:MAG: hypothetical protein FWF24_00040 [Alphaproteobacteria bacterium]|nr:hypothetical protein [Alphaproteobacteria bacterium]